MQLLASGDVNTVTSGAGPGQGNTFSGPLSSGEGLHASSQYLLDGGAASSLTINFATAVLGAGLFVIDYFNPTGGNNPLSLSAYTGVNGGGTLLGTFNSVALNFQRNHLYFMGITSSAADIQSVIFRDLSTATGDITGIDNIMIANGSASVPEAASTLMMVLGAILGLGVMGSTRRSRSAQNK